MTKALLMGVLLSATSTSFAAGPIPNSPMKQDTSDKRYANDLDSADVHDRLFAARVLRRRVKEAWRTGGANNETMRVMEARQRLSTFDIIVAPRCTRLLEVKNIAAPCVRILGLLETRDALGPLKTLQEGAQGFCLRRAIHRAIERIEAAQ